MSEIKRSKVMDMAATIVAGMMANPANGTTMLDNYALQNAIQITLDSLGNGLNSSGFQIVEDNDK